jgi:spore germination cell wall hydrolase CwlJ-like protein
MDNMVASLRTALLVFAAMSASSVAPAQVGPSAGSLLPVATAISPSDIAKELLRKSDTIAVPTEQDSAKQDEDSTAAAIDRNADLATMVAELRASDPGSRQLECLAVGVYFESKGEPLAGQLAVGQVIANRAASGRFADTYCGVIQQRGQFSFVHHGSWPQINRGNRSWQTAVAIAKIVDGDLKESSVADALYFHARRVSPGWHRARVASIGNHVFFR